MSKKRILATAEPSVSVNVTYGPWERADEEIAPVLAPSYGLRGRFLGVRLHHAQRRKVFKTWIENGEKMGRWDWEYAEWAS